MRVVITLNRGGMGRPEKLADAEVVLDGAMAGYKIAGFTVWQAREGQVPAVNFPARHYTVGGERREYAILRPVAGATRPDLTGAILSAYYDALNARGLTS